MYILLALIVKLYINTYGMINMFYFLPQYFEILKYTKSIGYNLVYKKFKLLQNNMQRNSGSLSILILECIGFAAPAVIDLCFRNSTLSKNQSPINNEAKYDSFARIHSLKHMRLFFQKCGQI